MDELKTRFDALERLVSHQRADIDRAEARIAELEQLVRVHHVALDAAGTAENVLVQGYNAMAAQIGELLGWLNLHTAALEKLIEEQTTYELRLGTPASPLERL